MATRKKKITTILLVIAFGLCALAVSAYIFINRPKKSIEAKKAEYTLASEQLLSEFENNEAAANTKYLDKVLLVEGIVSTVSTESGRTTVILDSGNPLSRISCELSAAESTKKITLNEGDRAKIKGICTGILMDVVLVDCVIVKE
jgi:hypothetical protein